MEKREVRQLIDGQEVLVLPQKELVELLQTSLGGCEVALRAFITSGQATGAEHLEPFARTWLHVKRLRKRVVEHLSQAALL